MTTITASTSPSRNPGHAAGWERRATSTFPSVNLPLNGAGLPVEVALIAQLGHGAGTQLFESISARQRAHPSFIDALDEPSARLGGMHLAQGDATSLYSFVVGPNGHPFHRHAGHRVFTAVSGSGGSRLRFSSALIEHIERDPDAFIASLHQVDIPPDCLFTVRFGGDTWHQFAPMTIGGFHPALVALSCHTNELGGELSEKHRDCVLANSATISSLTELLPQAVERLLHSLAYSPALAKTSALSLDAPPGSLHSAICRRVRGFAGRLRGMWTRWRHAGGYFSRRSTVAKVQELDPIPSDSLLRQQYRDGPIHHEDTFRLRVNVHTPSTASASAVLADVLEGFLANPPAGVTRLMKLRNALVAPFHLRTSQLGCPVSSLLSDTSGSLFARRYPVFEQVTDADDSRAQVVLGADDRHLGFRTCVGVQSCADGSFDITLGTRVQCRNGFGKFYIAAIDRIHRGYATPALLRSAVDHMLVLQNDRRGSGRW